MYQPTQRRAGGPNALYGDALGVNGTGLDRQPMANFAGAAYSRARRRLRDAGRRAPDERTRDGQQRQRPLGSTSASGQASQQPLLERSERDTGSRTAGDCQATGAMAGCSKAWATSKAAMASRWRERHQLRKRDGVEPEHWDAEHAQPRWNADAGALRRLPRARRHLAAWPVRQVARHQERA